MTTISPELEKQIETAYDFRGYVTIRLKDGKTVEAYLFNREYANPKLPEEYFIEVFLKSGVKEKYSMPQIESIAMTGEDCAAGNSYEEYVKKQKEKKA